MLSNSRPPSRAPSPSLSIRSARSTVSRTRRTIPNSLLTIEELALLPICGVFAYRAVKTFDPSASNPSTPAPRKFTRRVLVLDGHSGVGALSAQMLVRRGWKVIAHVSPEAVSSGGIPALSSSPTFRNLERRLRRWGVEDVCLGEATAVIAKLGERCKKQPGEYVIDGVLDTIGGLDIWNAALQHILSNPHKPTDPESGDYPIPPQFTTLVGDDKERTIPSAQDHFKAGLRSMKRAMNAACGYAWISVAADIDGEGLDVRDALAGMVKWVEGTKGRVKPHVQDPWNSDSIPGVELEVSTGKSTIDSMGRIVVFENAPLVFADGAKRLTCGGNVVVKVVS